MKNLSIPAGAFAMIFLAGCLQDGADPVTQPEESAQPGIVSVAWQTQDAPRLSVSLAKRPDREEQILLLEFISGKDTLLDSIPDPDLASVSKSFSLPSLRPYCVRGKLRTGARITHSGTSSLFFVEPAQSSVAQLVLKPLFAHLKFTLTDSVPDYVESPSLKVWIDPAAEPKTGRNEVAFDIPIGESVECSLGVFGDVWGHAQIEAWSGTLAIPALQPGESRHLTASLKWKGVVPVPGAADLEITVVQTGEVVAAVSLSGHPADRDRDGIPDDLDLCPEDPGRTCGQVCPACDTSAAPARLENLFHNPEPATRAYPRVGDHSRGWGGGSLSEGAGTQFDLVDTLIGYPQWNRGLAFTGGPTGWAGERCGERQVVMELGGRHALHGVDAYWHGREHVPATFRYEVLDGTAWSQVFSTAGKNGGSFVVDSLEYRGPGYGSTPTVVRFASPVMGSAVRLTLDNCDMAFQTGDSHGWLYDLRVWGIR